MVEIVNSVQKGFHKSCITSLGFDSNKIATGGKDSRVNFIEVSESNLRKICKFNLLHGQFLRVHVTSVDIVNDIIVCGSNCGSVHIIDARGANIKTISAHDKQINCVRFVNPAKNLIVSVGSDRKGKIWDIRQTRIPVNELIGHTAGVNSCDIYSSGLDHDDDALSFSDLRGRVLTVASDWTARLWNLSTGTNLVYKIPSKLSQNAESTCIISNKPHYIFAVGLDSQYLLVYSSKLKSHIGSLAFEKDVWVTCLRATLEFIIVGTSIGKLYFVKYEFSNNYSRCDLEVVASFPFSGSINDLRIEKGENRLTAYLALGKEVRLGRWKYIKLDGNEKPRNLINLTIFEF